ncbi:light induced alcohol dehydrogenase Bli-4 [Fusarium pseudoanthophilum]|uniref:Light induced alcohol dehydrogenase Bli-4 n=1 Tax=Fusarium pseudoanthophilum TaxID=48495 RepID=A0A8H5LB99_9HYPO|nr:light induced alcohol dehydrogenase Bli-4 [Fusarium pseudoanthophilum]
MAVRTQLFPPSPTFTESSLPSLSSRVYIVTGATSGVGLELAKILYSRSAIVYIAARNYSKITSAIKEVQSAFPDSTGRLESLCVDLSDLASIKPAAQRFLAKEPRLDGLVLNAGVMMPPEGSKTELGHELQMGTNCLGGYLLSRLLEELLVRTTVVADEGTVRVIWLASTLQMGTPKGGLVWDEVKKEPKVVKDQMENYMMSKAGNLLLAHETSRRLGSQGIISVAVNPGFLKTELQRHMPGPVSFMMGLMFKAPKHGAYSELFGLLSPDITAENNGALIYPWGRIGCIPDDIKVSLKNGQEGGTGLSKAFADWCERETRQYK